MKLKIKSLVAWIGGKDRHKIDTSSEEGAHGFLLQTPMPVSFVGTVTQRRDDLAELRYGKHNHKAAEAFHVEVTSFSQEPFPLELLLDIMDRAQEIREKSYLRAIPVAESGYTVTKQDAASAAVEEFLGVKYDALERFITLSDEWWNDIEVLRAALRGERQAERDYAKEQMAESEEDRMQAALAELDDPGAVLITGRKSAIEIVEADRPE